MATEKMRIEVWSDIVCPFCYLGKRRFANALEQFAARDEVEVVWKSFQLMPSLKTDPGISIDQLLAREKGIDSARATALHEQLAEAGRQEGLTYRFDDIVVANTFDAHRFAHFSADHGRQAEAIDRLFRAYFAEGRNIDDVPTLLELGDELGLDRQALSTALASDAYVDAVRADIDDARALGIHGVPFFVFDRQYAVSGAQAPSVFLRALQQAHDAWAAARPDPALVVAPGAACTVDDCA